MDQDGEVAGRWGTSFSSPGIPEISRKGAGSVDGERGRQTSFPKVPRGAGGRETEQSAALKCGYAMRGFHFDLDFHRDCQRATQRSLA